MTGARIQCPRTRQYSAANDCSTFCLPERRQSRACFLPVARNPASNQSQSVSWHGVLTRAASRCRLQRSNKQCGWPATTARCSWCPRRWYVRWCLSCPASGGHGIGWHVWQISSCKTLTAMAGSGVNVCLSLGVSGVGSTALPHTLLWRQWHYRVPRNRGVRRLAQRIQRRRR